MLRARHCHGQQIDALEERIFMADTDFPVKVAWVSGKHRGRGALAYHREMEVHFVRRGEGEYFIEDCCCPYRKNHLILICPDIVHRGIPQPEAYLEKWSLFFPLSVLPGEGTHLVPPQSCCLELDERAATEAEVVFRIIEEENRSRDVLWKELIVNQLSRILLLGIRAGTKVDTVRPNNPLVKELIRYIEVHFRGELNLAVLQEEFSYSPSHISRVFKQCTGLNLHQYITQRRIAEAKRLLEEGTLKVDAVADATGFSDFALFNRNFKRVTGFTPSAYRKISHPDA